MKKKLLFLTLTLVSLVSLTSNLNAYWVDRDGNEHYGVVSGSVDAADDAVHGAAYATGDVLSGVFGGYHHHCDRHPRDPRCN